MKPKYSDRIGKYYYEFESKYTGTYYIEACSFKEEKSIWYHSSVSRNG